MFPKLVFTYQCLIPWISKIWSLGKNSSSSICRDFKVQKLISLFLEIVLLIIYSQFESILSRQFLIDLSYNDGVVV